MQSNSIDSYNLKCQAQLDKMEELKNKLGELTKNDPEWLKQFRAVSFDKFLNLPVETSEIFKYQNKFQNFRIEEIKLEIGKGKQKPAEIEKNGIIFKPIKKAIEENENLVKNLILKLGNEDKFEAFNNAFFSFGNFLYIPKNTRLTDPIRLINIVNSESLFNKTIVFVDSNSKLKIVKEDYSNNYTADNSKTIYSDSVEIFVKDNSELEFSSVQNLNQNTIHFTNKTAFLNKDSKIVWNIGYFGGKKIRSRVNSFLMDEGSSAEDIEFIFGNKEQQFDTYSTLNHIGRTTTGRVILKSILKDNCESVFKGMIKIEEKAKNSNSYLAEHGMLLSKSSKANAIPALEIKTNEVKATHAASIAQIDDELIFYLMTRGLSEDQAKKMIALGFFEPLIQAISFDEVRAKILHLLELKWIGEEDNFIKSFYKAYETYKSNKKAPIDIFEGHYKYR